MGFTPAFLAGWVSLMVLGARFLEMAMASHLLQDWGRGASAARGRTEPYYTRVRAEAQNRWTPNFGCPPDSLSGDLNDDNRRTFEPRVLVVDGDISRRSCLCRRALPGCRRSRLSRRLHDSLVPFFRMRLRRCLLSYWRNSDRTCDPRRHIFHPVEFP